MEYIKIGTLLKPFGLKGEMKVYPHTEFVEERFAKGNIIYFGDEKKPFEIISFRIHKETPLVVFKGYDDINLIEKYTRTDLYIKESERPKLKQGEYYFSELKGLEVLDETGTVLGFVLQVEEGLAHNHLRIEKLDKTTALIPYVDAFIKKVDLNTKRIIIRIIEGLL